ncbi:MAG: tripartite tricarboxylate transporter substrate binding protein [Proteobacteria bacterium]|nr:tripartite tricarboxylate transporter substrate binding protein [Pseudomonadota bacterium]
MRILIAAAVSLAAMTAPAAAWPDRPVTVVVNSAPGGGADILARTLADGFTQALGQRAVVENKPGAGGNIAGAQVARAAADGYTLLLADSGMLAINPTLYPTMPFNPKTDFTPIARVASFAIAVAAHPSTGIRSIDDLVTRAKASPGKVTFASTGIGSPQHLAAVMLQKAAGIQMEHVPYRGGGPALTDLSGGHVMVGFIGIPPLAPVIRDGRLNGLGVTSTARSKSLPDVPAIAERFSGFEAQVWFALMAPKSLPAEIGTRLAAVVRETLERKETLELLDKQGFNAFLAGPAELSTYLDGQIASWGEAVRTSGARAE